MNPSSTYPVHYQLPKIELNYFLGATPKRLSPNDQPDFLFCDAGMIGNDMHQIFNKNADVSIYKRYEGLSPKSAQRTLIFAATPVEMQILNHFKEVKKKQLACFPVWSKALEGPGTIKQYEDMRAASYLHQEFLVPIEEIMASSVLSCETDLKLIDDQEELPEPVGCDPDDRERNDLRIHSFCACAALVLARYPMATIYFYIRSDSLVGRIKEIISSSPDGKSPLSKFGTVRFGLRANRIKKDLDKILVLDKYRADPSQPKVHPCANPPRLEYDDLVKKGDTYIVNPACLPLDPLPSQLVVKAGVSVRAVPDTNVFSHRHWELCDIVGKFVGDIKLASLLEIERELQSAGVNPTPGKIEAAKARWARFKTLMRVKPSDRHTDLGPIHQPRIYEPFTPSRMDDTPPANDMKIRSELALLGQHLKNAGAGQEVVLVFFTIDYGCQLLVQSVHVPGITFITVRIGDPGEKDELFQKIFYAVLRKYFV